ncbi:MAG: hypothetical protein M3Y21_06115 [Candidatus Eremiobacteraeota bacterium]|nr:hypothetical protein [Candidatus Eremiobacteraeota bacterium]
MTYNYELIAVWSQIISAIVFVAALIWIWIKFIQPAIIAAQTANNKQIAEAERRRDDQKASVDVLQGEIATAQHDAQAIRARAGEQVEREGAQALAQAHDEGERAVKNARGELDRRRVAAREQMRGELLDKALDLARVDATSRVDGALNTELVNRFVASLERGGAN